MPVISHKLQLFLLVIVTAASVIVPIGLLLSVSHAGHGRKLSLDKHKPWKTEILSSSSLVREIQTSDPRTELERVSMDQESASDTDTQHDHVSELSPSRMADTGIYQERIQHLREACQAITKVGNGTNTTSMTASPHGVPGKDVAKDFFVSTVHKLVYCSVQKVGSSFWKKAFRILNSVETSKSIFHQSGIGLHYSNENITFENKNIEWQLQQLNHSLKFLFVRHPFARTFSAYIDKIFLPFYADSVYVNGDSGYINDFRYDQSACSLQVPTFAEFIRSQVSETVSLFTYDPHFTAIHTHCSPCTVLFDVVGKMESFRQDAEYILDKVGVRLGDLTDDPVNFNAHSDLNLMMDIAQRILILSPVWGKLKSEGCEMAMHELLRRMWTVFQVRGLLSASVRFPLNPRQSANAIIPDLLLAIKNGYDASGTRDQRLQQREAAMMEAFRSVPFDDLKRLQAIHAVDCAIFGYDCSLDRFGLAHNDSLLYGYAFFWS